MVEKKEGLRKSSDETKKILDLSEVSLTLDTYDDIFSDFDPRVYSQRAISHDLLDELKRATRESKDQLHLTFIIPREKRKWDEEELIKNRLRSHFKKHHIDMISQVKKLKYQGYGMSLLGALMIFVASIFYGSEINNLALKFILTLLEPAGWFTAWTGLEDIYYTGREIKKELHFYEKMSNSEIEFLSY